MGIVRTVTHTSAWPILVLVRMNAAARASVTEASVPSSAETMELTSAAPKRRRSRRRRGLPVGRASRRASRRGPTTATRKKATSSKRMVPNPESPCWGMSQRFHVITYWTYCMKRLRPILRERFLITKLSTKGDAGLDRSSSGVPVCSMEPAFMTMILSERAKASSWSWVI